jgi:hypothetical protein
LSFDARATAKAARRGAESLVAVVARAAIEGARDVVNMSR